MAEKLLEVTERSLFKAVEQCLAGQPARRRLQRRADARVEAEGLSVVRSLVGHGIGRSMHEEPQIPNYGPAGKGIVLEEGMVLAIEPMVTAGRHMVRMGDDGWAIYSQDGSLAAHFEFTVAVTADGPRILNPWHLSGQRVAAYARQARVPASASSRRGRAARAAPAVAQRASSAAARARAPPATAVSPLVALARSRVAVLARARAARRAQAAGSLQRPLGWKAGRAASPSRRGTQPARAPPHGPR